MANSVSVALDASTGTYKCPSCGYTLDIVSNNQLPPCPWCGTGKYDTPTLGGNDDDRIVGRGAGPA